MPLVLPALIVRVGRDLQAGGSRTAVACRSYAGHAIGAKACWLALRTHAWQATHSLPDKAFGAVTDDRLCAGVSDSWRPLVSLVVVVLCLNFVSFGTEHEKQRRNPEFPTFNIHNIPPGLNRLDVRSIFQTQFIVYNEFYEIESLFLLFQCQ